MLVVMGVGSTVQGPDKLSISGILDRTVHACAVNPLYSRPVSGRDPFSGE